MKLALVISATQIAAHRNSTQQSPEAPLCFIVFSVVVAESRKANFEEPPQTHNTWPSN